MPPQEKYKAVLERARKRFRQAVDAEQEIRTEALIDLEYLAGEQWDPKLKAERERPPSPRPCLVFNKVLPPVTQLGNQARQNKPAIKVSPVDSAGDVETAKVLQGMVRHIEYDSDADQAYDTALFYAAGCGFGYWRYTCEYADDESFDQNIKTVTVNDPFSIYLDCYARKPDRSDMKWAFAIDKMSNETHEARFGPDEADLTSDFLSDLTEEGWLDDDGKRVAEYWEIESKEKTLRLRKDEDGTVHPVYLEDLEEDEDPDQMQWEMDEETEEPRERKVQIPEVMQYIINGAAVLEEPTKWDGSTIPIVMVTGLEMVVRGVRKIFSMTRFARDPQLLLNYYKTMEAETIALAPKPKWVGFVGQFKTKRRDWARANTDNAAFLEADMVEVGGKAAPLPHWETFDPPIQALAIGAAAAVDDIKASTGYFDPSLGQNKSDQSGIAIKSLQKQGDVSNFHFLDNLARGLKRGGRIVIELIPKKYDTAREVRIIGDDQKERIVMVNAPYVDETGKAQFHQLDRGKFDVRVSQGQSWEGQRAETREMIMTIAQGDPAVWQLAADVFFENQDFIGADRLAKRFHSILPPAVLAAEDGGEQDIPPQIQAKMAQQEQALQQLTEQNKQLLELAKGKMAELQVRADSAERIATQNNESKERIAAQSAIARIESALALSKSAEMNAVADREYQAIKDELDRREALLHAGITVEQDAAGAAMQHQEQARQRQHEKEMQSQQAQQDQQAQGADHAQEAALQGADQEHQAEQQQSAQDATAEQQAQAQKAAAALPKPGSTGRKT
jgi:hypothetical protein